MSKLPTAEETLLKNARRRYAGDVVYTHGDSQVVITGDVLAAIESHTQAHTEGLREELKLSEDTIKHQAERCLRLEEGVKELEEAIEYLYMCFKRDGIVASDFDKAKKAMREEALR